MIITVEIKPAARGMDLPAYAAAILEQVAQPAPLEPKNRSIEEFEKTLDRIAQFSHKIPALPDEAFSRENLYQDHD